MNEHLPEDALKQIISRALEEDIGPGDVTTAATIDEDASCRADIIAKSDGVVAGLPVAAATFRALDGGTAIDLAASDGDPVREGAIVARVAGRARAVLTAERTALNFLQRMSGTATLTARYVAAVEGTGAEIIDTRKTAPGLRLLDKYAVRMGGGSNHRFGLFDGILIKENHIRASGGVRAAVERARASAHHVLKIEVEAESLTEVEEALGAGANVVMLDNMSVEQVSEAVRLVAGRCALEVSGGVDLDTVRPFAECGVDYISVGALTHSAPALDFSLEMLDD
jgi:nicotinate-nucleotide pyrophosphorylase (carboxylating)